MIWTGGAKTFLAGSALATALVFHCSAGAAALGIVDDPCPPVLPVPKVVLDATEAMLTPGSTDIATLKSRLDTQEVRDVQAASAERAKLDWPNLCKYRRSNQSLKHPPDAVFMGDSITEYWLRGDPSLFSEQILDRGISGQTAPQMLLRFFQDVINLHPKVVLILAGTNDVAGNTGPSTVEDFRNNIEAMSELAKAHHIRVVLGSITPAGAFPWRPDIKPADAIKDLNQWLKTYAQAHGLEYVDYYSVLVDGDGAFKARLSADGVHPNRDGYALMRPLALAAINR